MRRRKKAFKTLNSKTLFLFLKRSVGQPWVQVRDTVIRRFRPKQLAYTELSQLVMENVVILPSGKLRPAGLRLQDYVEQHPIDFLCVHPIRQTLITIRITPVEAYSAKECESEASPYGPYTHISGKAYWQKKRRYFRKLDGIWFDCLLSPIPAEMSKGSFLMMRDHVLRNPRGQFPPLQDLFWIHGVEGIYCSSVRQLSSREIQAFNLPAQEEGPPQ